MLKNVRATFILFLLGCLFNSIAHASQDVRVLIAENQKSMTLTVKDGFTIKTLPSGQILKKGEHLPNLTLAATSKGLKLGAEEWSINGIRIEPSNDRDLFLNQSRFRGAVDIYRQGPLLYAINRLDVENYLYGVLPHEVASWWPMEALRAQAIAARTYALYQVGASHAAQYDLKSSTSSQVYGGSTTERYRAKRAVDETKGKVLTYLGKVFPAYFHATCGGKTAGAQELWKIYTAPVSGGVSCSFCRFSPHFYWTSKVPLAEIEEIMNKNARPIGRILNIQPVTQTPSGRVGSLRLTGTNGDMVIAAKDFRIWVGGNRMKSTMFDVEIKDDQVVFHGRGWGHGVGLCQWGALGQALLGHSHEEILKFYYPGAEISDAT